MYVSARFVHNELFRSSFFHLKGYVNTFVKVARQNREFDIPLIFLISSQGTRWYQNKMTVFSAKRQSLQACVQLFKPNEIVS